MVTDALTALNHRRVFEFAAAHRLPAIYEFEALVRDGFANGRNEIPPSLGS